MALEGFLATSSSTTESKVPPTPQAQSQQDVIQARAEVVQENAGQRPPTTRKSLLPYVKGGLTMWLLIMVVLWLSFVLYNRSQGHDMKVSEVVEVAKDKVEEVAE